MEKLQLRRQRSEPVVGRLGEAVLASADEDGVGFAVGLPWPSMALYFYAISLLYS
jgi:hypothetical protein